MNLPRGLLVGMLGIGLVGATGCSQKCCDEPPVAPQPLRVSAAFANQTTSFAFESFRRISDAAPGENVFFSPLSLHMALGMVLNGAKGQTKTEMQQTLRFDGQTLTEANQTYSRLLDDLPRLDPQTTIRLANAVWYRNGFTVAPTFETMLRDTFKARTAALDFSSPAAVNTVNQWASDNTSGLVPKVLDRIEPNEVMLLLNAIYFKGTWKTQFEAARTVDALFTLANGQQKTVRMMRLETELRQASQQNYVAFELPYGSGNTAMTALLPTNSMTAERLLGTFTVDDWTKLQASMAAGKIYIGLPKFAIKTEANLEKVLSNMGMPTAFDGRADFTGISPNGRLYLTRVKQNAFVTVDERGTAAAAVTTVGFGVTSGPRFYQCDRPFVVVIHEKVTGTILFMGKIANPSV